MSETITLHDANGSSFRLVMRDGTYRDFTMGVHVVAEGDESAPELVAWAEKQPNISIHRAGKATKQGSENCHVCGVPVAANDLPAHMDDVHVDYESIRQSVGLEARSEEPRPRRARRR
jgi:hypothetical protein